MKFKIFITFLVSLSTITLFAQVLLDTEMSNRVQDIIPLDNIYIQTDKEVYKPSEIIWFKAYVLDTNTQKLSLKNNTLFVTLKNKVTNEVVFEDKFKIVNGNSNGDIFIEEKFGSGDFYLSAYTSTSIVDNTLSIKSFKRITIKNDETKVLLESQFDKDAYTAGSNLKVKLSFYDNRGDDYSYEKVKISHYKNKELLASNTLVTNENGIIQLTLDKIYVDPEVSTEIKINNKTKEKFNLNIPFEKENKIVFDLFPEGGKIIYDLPCKLAYKATNTMGVPIHVKGELYEDQKHIQSFLSFHDGMGFLKFLPKRGSTYSIKLTAPFSQMIKFPTIEDVGYSMFIIENSEDFLKVHIEKSKEIESKEVILVMQSKGVTYWKANVSLNKASGLFNIPKKKMLKGISVLTLFNKAMLPVAERLVYANMVGELQIKNLVSLEDKYSKKDRIVLKLKVEDEYGKPAYANLGLRVYDNAFYSPNNITDIQSHYNLFSNLKGEIHNPFYYFDPENKHRYVHLDLLLLTHGWRNYVYAHDNLTHIIDNANNKLEDIYILKILELNKDDKLVSLSRPITVDLVWSTGMIEATVDTSGLLIVPYIENDIVLVKTRGIKRYFFKANDPFNVLTKMTRRKDYKVSRLLEDTHNKRTKIQLKAYFARNHTFLDEVTVRASKNRSALRGSANNRRKWVSWEEGDYVCEEYNIFNCANHNSGGYVPINGRRYRTNTKGLYIVYFKAPEQRFYEEDLRKRGYQYVKGHMLKKEFYAPNYDTESRDLIDIRTTLAWEPNLTTDKNGFVNYTFYTSEINSSFTIHIEGVDSNGNIGSKFYNFSVKTNFE
jgi:hypothetical protein